MPNLKSPSKATKARHAELQARITEMHRKEDAIKNKIYKLEASIVAAPAWEAQSRLRNRNSIAAEDYDDGRGPQQTRWQAQRMDRARSSQAILAFFLLALFAGFVICFYYTLKAHGLL